MRNLLFSRHLAQSRSLTSFGMTAFRVFQQAVRCRARSVLAAGVFLLICLAAPARAGELPAQLALADLHGRPHTLEELRGSIVVVNFWATWCLPCRDEMPILIKIQRRFGDDGIRVIGASTDDEAAHDEVARVAREMRLNFPVWVGATVLDMQRLGLGSALPATVILDRDGAIIDRIPRVVDEHELIERLEWLLSDRSGPAPTPDAEDDDADEAHAGHDDHDHGDTEEDHQHGGVGMEGASLVPS